MTTKLAPIHPGEILREEFMKPLGLSSNALANDLKVTSARVNEIVRGRRGITADTALRLARYFSTDAQSWINLQTNYEIEVAEDAAGDVIATIVPHHETAQRVRAAEETGYDPNTIPHAVVMRMVEDVSAARAWREYLGLTQDAVAKRMGVGQSAYAQMEASTSPRADTRLKIADAMGIHAGQLVPFRRSLKAVAADA